MNRPTGGHRKGWLLVIFTALVCNLPVWAVQQGADRPARVLHSASAEVLASAAQEQAMLDADDARFFLTRVGFAPDNAEVSPYVGLTREQAVDKVLAATRTEAITPMPAWVLEPVPSRDTRKAWSVDQRR